MPGKQSQPENAAGRPSSNESDDICASWELWINLRSNSREASRRFAMSSNSQPTAIRSFHQCQGAVLRARSKAQGEDSLSNEREAKDGWSEMELRITSAMDTILRYQSSLKRDFYRAIQLLHSLQDGKTRGNAPPDPEAVQGQR
jgi:hypothetical protein